ncbi:MAG: hypothetical protein A3A86_08345 [Elusimicrobia bacterium RIFCSPLOWO2_01_FULL_60_11]|nr:MAG: hypothetical protein A3A86_08345 [Elusimicrobia bacterium RIFCSPLOWO2_01_FULL_60_11]
MPGLVLAKGPTTKEKVAALASAGKTIPVVYLTAGINGVSVVPPSIMETAIFNNGAVPADYAAIGDEAVKSFNAGFGVTAFKTVPSSQIPVVEKAIWGKVPDWAATDFELYVAVTVSGQYKANLASSTGAKSAKLNMKCAVEVMENIVDKKGQKKSDSIKTLRFDAQSKTAPIEKTPATLEDFSAAIPAASLTADLLEKEKAEIAKFAAK